MSGEIAPSEAELGALATPWVSATSYWIPNHIVDSAWLEHAAFSAWLMSELRPASVVELGTHHGFSYFAFCDFAQRLRLPTRLTAIDTWEGDEHAGFYGEDVFTAVTALNQQYEAQSTLVRSRFDEARGDVADGSVDLLHIDGRHRYEDVVEDFELYLPSMSNRGVVMLHDIAEHRDDFGVYRFWEEIKQRFPTFEFFHEHGLGVVLVGAETAPALLTLTEANDVTKNAVRSAYARIGRRTRDVRHLVVRAAYAAELELHVAEDLRLIEKLKTEAFWVAENVANLTAQQTAYESSKSWRLTAPLRRVTNLFRR